MNQVDSISSLPTVPAVYAMYGGQRGNKYVAYVGVAKNLKQRVTQHLIRRDSSVTTQTSAVCLNPDMITELRWWEDSSFSDRTNIEAAELIAFDVLQPALRSRGAIREESSNLYSDAVFGGKYRGLFTSPPSGILTIIGLEDIKSILKSLENRISMIEQKLAELG